MNIRLSVRFSEDRKYQLKIKPVKSDAQRERRISSTLDALGRTDLRAADYDVSDSLNKSSHYSRRNLQ